MLDADPISYLDKGYPCVISGISRVWEEAKNWGMEKRLGKGETFSFRDETLTNFVYIKSGEVACMFYENNGAAHTNFICREGALINETCTTLHSFSCRMVFLCMTPVTLYAFNGDLVFNRQFTEKFPHLIRNMLSSSATKLLHLQVMLNAVCTRSKLHQVCWYIWSMSQHHQGKCEFEPGLSQAEVCALLGLSKTSMKRSMAYLKEHGIVTIFTKRRLIIENPERLAELATLPD